MKGAQGIDRRAGVRREQRRPGTFTPSTNKYPTGPSRGQKTRNYFVSGEIDNTGPVRWTRFANQDSKRSFTGMMVQIRRSLDLPGFS